ncbi:MULTISPECIES: TetR/AcrR family transcriptional regulator [Raoultella]|jgi:AcrR family transcriptional regulator|uniref:Transcriptional regulator n=1 Tax=Raoultella planticola TaxID=575 RepID=A0A8G2A5W1_RAOPL|nr:MULTISPECIES: TetR/AcrR family transcriptional regulator [Raoultella]MDU4424366.1 TetR/AcrR family transcriptional regulator [Raoultella sp.]AUV55496.1 TetR family transcriptional regulator [Raoultella planticola]EJR0221711.1 TetR/AcrR family transcriptional regulator [Raoultella planticola]EJR0352597.1 TetR/AcrR family transcriptional regulator [Raoultella planticola]ELU1428522.1 TetR/AcrR family transcriptional regulator [Raoultella planticola]
MARPLSPQKQAALLEAAVAIVAQSGLSATTASIAKRAEVAVGTLFTYFPTKEQLLNEVYLMLKQDMSDLLVSGYPKDADFRTQIMHIWRAYTEWSLKNPDGKQVLRLLTVSDLLTPETLARTPEALNQVDKMFDEAIKQSLFATDCKTFIYAIIQNIADATSEQIVRHPEEKDKLLQLGFTMMWRAITV